MYGRRPRCKRNLTISEAFGCGHVWTAPAVQEGILTISEAFRVRSCMDGAAVQEESDYQRSVRVRSCMGRRPRCKRNLNYPKRSVRVGRSCMDGAPRCKENLTISELRVGHVWTRPRCTRIDYQRSVRCAVMYGTAPRCKRNPDYQRSVRVGHVWTAPAVQEESDYQRSVRCGHGMTRPRCKRNLTISGSVRWRSCMDGARGARGSGLSAKRSVRHVFGL